MRLDQQRMFAIVLLIIAVLLLIGASSFIGYILSSNQQAQRTIIPFAVDTPIPTPTPDNSFSQFLAGFSQALAS